MAKFFKSRKSVSGGIGSHSSTNLVSESDSFETELPTLPSGHYQSQHRPSEPSAAVDVRKQSSVSSITADHHFHLHNSQGSFSSSSSTDLSNSNSNNKKLRSNYAVYVGRNAVQSLLPIFTWVSHYPLKKYFVFGDLLAGIYIGLYQIPQCIAFSILAGVPATHALYTCLLSSILYSLFGSHRRLSYGMSGLVSALYTGIMIDRARTRFSRNNTGPMDSVALIGVASFLIGAYSLAGSLFRLGSLVRFVPYEILSALRAGVALLIFSLQINSMIGIDSVMEMDPGDGLALLTLPRLYGIQLYPHLAHHINWHAVFVSGCCFASLALFRLTIHYWPQIFGPKQQVFKNILRLVPVEFILVSVGFAICYKVDVSQYKLSLVGQNSTGSDSFGDLKHFQVRWPQFKSYFPLLWTECITATILAIVYAHSLAVDFNVLDTELKLNRKSKYQIDVRRVKYLRFGWKSYHPNHELRSQGIVNLIVSFCKCLPGSVSATRSYRLRNVGGRSQIAGLVSSVTVGLIWLSLHQYLRYTPRCVVASIAAFDSLLAFKQEVAQLKHYWTVSSIDLVVWILGISSFIFLNLDYSLYVSLALALAVFVFRSRLFSGYRFQLQRPIVTKAGSSLIVPDSVFQQSNSKFETNEETDQADVDVFGGGAISADNFMSTPVSRLRDVFIFKLEQKYLTVANVDSFVRDVFRQISKVSRTQPRVRLIFDCRHLNYIDWPSVRAVKATLMRTIEVADSWRLLTRNGNGNHPPLVNNGQKMSVVSIYESDQSHQIRPASPRPMIVAFVFPAKMVQLIHNAGRFNVRFYHSLHKTLHIGLRGAIYSVVSFDDILGHNDNCDNPSDNAGAGGMDKKPYFNNNNEDNSYRNHTRQPSHVAETFNSAEQSDLTHAGSWSNSPKQRQSTALPNSNEDGTEKVYPIAFRPNDNGEFSYTSSFGSRSTASNRSKRSKILMEELFEPFNSSGGSGNSLSGKSTSKQKPPPPPAPTVSQFQPGPSHSLPRASTSHPTTIASSIPHFHNPNTVNEQHQQSQQQSEHSLPKPQSPPPVIVITEPPRASTPLPPLLIQTTAPLVTSPANNLKFIPSPPPLPMPPPPLPAATPASPVSQASPTSQTPSTSKASPISSVSQAPSTSQVSPPSLSFFIPPPPPPPPPSVIASKPSFVHDHSPSINITPWTSAGNGLPETEPASNMPDPSKPSIGLVPSFRTKLENMLRHKSTKYEFEKGATKEKAQKTKVTQTKEEKDDGSTTSSNNSKEGESEEHADETFA